MESGGGYYSPYYQPAAPYYYNYPQPRVRGGGGQSSSVYAFILLVTVSFIAATTLYTWCESAMESLVDQLRRLLILSPLIVIIAVQLWVATGGGGGGDGVMSLLAEMVTGDKYGGGGAGSSSPWGVALALVLVLFLVSLFGQTGDRYGAGGAAGSSSLWGVALVLSGGPRNWEQGMPIVGRRAGGASVLLSAQVVEEAWAGGARGRTGGYLAASAERSGERRCAVEAAARAVETRWLPARVPVRGCPCPTPSGLA